MMGNMGRDEGNLILSRPEAAALVRDYPEARRYLLPLLGTKEIVGGLHRYALHLEAKDERLWSKIPPIIDRVASVKTFRIASKAKTTNAYASVPHRFAQYCHRDEIALALPSVTPEDRTYVTPILLPSGHMVTNLAYLAYGTEPYAVAIISSRMHSVWIHAVSGRLGEGIRYTPTVSYHTFAVPSLTQTDKADLTRCAEDILLAREVHFPATISELYQPETDEWRMPENLRAAHEANDDMLERIYIGRRFRNDTERLEKLFEMYTKMTSQRTGTKEQEPARRSGKQVTA